MGNPLFNSLSKEAVSVQKGSIIMREGEIGQCAYFVVQGRLLVEKCIEGENIPIAEIGPRDMVGEFAILDDAPRSATVTAMENSVLIVLNKHRIRSLIRRSPAVAEVIMKLLCHKLRSRNQTLKNATDLVNPDLWRKICSLLLLCAKSEDNPSSLYHLFRQYVLTICEIPPQSMPDVLQRLEKANAIETQGQKTLCIDEDKLNLFVELSTEEYANISVEIFSEVKEYHAAQVLLQSFPEPSPGKTYVEAPKNRLIQAMLASSLWKDLRPHYQYQRSEAMINYMLAKETIDRSPTSNDILRFNPRVLVEIDVPQEALIEYESMKTTLLK